MSVRAASLFTLILVLSSCSLPSFEELEAEREAEQELAGNGEEETGTTGTSGPRGPVIDDGVVSGDELPDPAWIDIPLATVQIAEYETPIAVVARSGTDDLYVAQRNGIVRRIQRRFNSRGAERITTDTRVVLDISDQVTVDGERGLLDIAFSRDSRFLYVSHTDANGDSVIAEYDIDRATTANASSRRELVRVPQPYSNHNGGDIEIGADGFLYIALGDGGNSGDPDGNGQNVDTLLGSVLRIDPVETDGVPYLVPDGNPFAEGDGQPEIFLYGVRNPWRISFDAVTGDLWIADVGQNDFEEINHLAAATGGGRGANLGWNQMEAFTRFENGTEPVGHTRPVYAYAHDEGRCSVTGGPVYRGAALPLLDGVYIFGDYCSGEVFGLDLTSEGTRVRPLPINLDRNQLVSIGTARDGELYLVLVGGQILRVEAGAVPDEASSDQ